MDLWMEVRRQNGSAVVALGGEVDVFTAPQLRDKLLQLLESGYRKIVVDLDALDFCDSNGLSVLVGGLKRLKDAEGSLGIVCTRGTILKLLRSTGLTKVFAIFDSVEAAVTGQTAAKPPREAAHR